MTHQVKPQAAQHDRSPPRVWNGADDANHAEVKQPQGNEGKGATGFTILQAGQSVKPNTGTCSISTNTLFGKL